MPTTACDVVRRRATPNDEALLRTLFLESRDDLVHLPPALVELQLTAQRRQIAADHPQARDQILVADGRDVGRLLLDDGAEDVRIVDLVVLAAHRRRGIATAALSQVLAGAAGRRVTLSVWSQNVAAIRVYERLGFTTTSGGVGYHAMAHGTDG